MKTINDPNIWGIKGGGFGLYGYFPALCKWQKGAIHIESKHSPTIQARPELKGYLDRIIWVADEDTLLAESSSLVVCIPPTMQQKLLLEKISKKYKCLVIEKPLATSPDKANEVLNYSMRHAQAVRVGYSLLSTEWAKQLITKLLKITAEEIACNYHIKWYFLAHHIKNNNFFIWKSQQNQGGGILRFYGVHLIAILASIENIKLVSSSLYLSKDKIAVRWMALFKIHQTTIDIDIDSNSINELFSISRDEFSVISQKNPFTTNLKSSSEDNRIQFLLKILSSLQENNIPYYSLYSRTIDLWGDIEKTSGIIYAT